MLDTARRSELEQEIARFLYREAWLLDEWRLHEWVALFTDDARYRMPVRELVQGSDTGVPADDEFAVRIFDDDKTFLEMRARRLDTGLAHAEQPRSRTRHLITNIWLDDASTADEVIAHSNFIVYQANRDRAEDFYVGRREDRLRRVDGEWKIARRTIVLDQTVLPRTLTLLF
jgi:3-phenylpropionate/cinnamic acid dioxygenase small subunit